MERPKNIESEEDGMLEWADDGEFSPPMSLAEDRDKFLIFTTGSKTYSPHQIGVCIRVPQIMPDMNFFFFFNDINTWMTWLMILLLRKPDG